MSSPGDQGLGPRLWCKSNGPKVQRGAIPVLQVLQNDRHKHATNPRQCFRFQRALKTITILFEPQNRPMGKSGHVFGSFPLRVLGKA